MKRATDLVIAAVLAVVTAPFMALIAAAVRLDSSGPIIFRQVRIGRDGRPFRIHKFRTMEDAATGLRITTTGDSRVTRTGRFLRATKLDELPQLFDVLSGAMSLVGPRPEVPEYVRRWPASDRRTILSVRPGITDPVTVDLRWESEILASQDDPERYYVDVLLPAKAAAYVDYVNHRSLVGDLRIMTKTVQRVFARAD